MKISPWPLRTIIILLSLNFFSCGSTFISRKNLGEHNSVLAEAAQGYTLTMPIFYDHVYRGDYFASGGIIPPEQLEPILDSILLDTLIGLEARTIDLHDYPDSERRFKIRYVELMVKSFFEETVYSKISFDSLDVLNHYYGDSARYHVDEQVFAYNLLINEKGLLKGADSLKYKGMSDGQLKEEARKLTEQILSLMQEGKSFPALVEEYSHDEYSATRRGELGWVKRQRYRQPFDSVAFSLRPGEVSRPYYDDEGWHVIYVEDRYDHGVPPMTDEIFKFASSNLVADMAAEQIRQLTDSITSQPKKLIYNEEILDQDPFRLDGQLWCAILNDVDSIPVFNLRSAEQKYRLDGGGVADVETRRGFIDNLARTYSVLEAARAIKVDTLPWVASEIERWHHDYTRSLVWARQFDKAWLPPDSLIRDYYDRHIELYQSDTPLNVLRIVLADSLMAEYVKSLAEGGSDFMELAREHYNAPVTDRERLASVGWIGPQSPDTATYGAARITPNGGVSRVTPVTGGYMIVKLVEQFRSRTVEQARTTIANTLKQRHGEEVYGAFRDVMFKKYDVSKKSLPKMHFPPSDFREP